MRVNGRTIRASNLADRRVLKSLGIDALRIPRRLNPFKIARQLGKISAGTGGSLPELRAMLGLAKGTKPPPEDAGAHLVRDVPEVPVVPSLPDSTSEPREAHAA